MKLIALVRPAASVEVAAPLVARAMGLVPAEARMRMRPEPPALLGVLPDGDADRLCEELRRAGLAALALPAAVPGDEARVVARRFVLGDDALEVSLRRGDGVSLAYGELALLLRGVRGQRRDETSTEKHRTASVGAAALTGGLVLTRTETRTSHSSREAMEHFVLAYDRAGTCVALYGGEVLFEGLGPRLEPSKAANIGAIAAILRERAPSATYDDRLLRLGRRSLPFVAQRDRHTATATTSTVESDSSRTVDVVAAFLHKAMLEGLLP